MSPKQLEFHNHAEVDKDGNPVIAYTYYGGGMGGGKSHAIGASALWKAVFEPGAQIAVFRLRETDVISTTLKVFLGKVCIPGSELWNWCGIDWNKSKNTFTISRNQKPGVPPSQIHFFGLTTSGGSNSESFGKLLSDEFTHVYIDEAYEIDEDIMGILPTRVRLSRPGMKYSYSIKICSNPAPGWIYEWFIGTPIPNSKFIQALFTDNLRNLPQEYASSFDRMTEAQRRRFKDGDHNAFDGQVWPGGVGDKHLIDPIEVASLRPEEWKFIQSVDPGLNDPTAALWCVYNYENDLLIVLQEYELEETDVSDHATRFKIIESQIPFQYHVTRIIDPAAGQRSLASTDMASNVLRLFKRHGLYYKRAANSIQIKTISMNERLANSPLRCHPLTGKPGCPGILFVEEATKKTRKAISGMMWEETRGEKPKWKNRNKHLVDCATYATAHLSRSKKREDDEDVDFER